MPNGYTLNLTILKAGDVIGQVCFLQNGEVELFDQDEGHTK